MDLVYNNSNDFSADFNADGLVEPEYPYCIVQVK